MFLSVSVTPSLSHCVHRMYVFFVVVIFVFTVAFCLEHKRCYNRIGKVRRNSIQSAHNVNAIKPTNSKQNAANDANENARFVYSKTGYFFALFSSLLANATLQTDARLLASVFKCDSFYLCMRNASISIGVAFLKMLAHSFPHCTIIIVAELNASSFE